MDIFMIELEVEGRWIPMYEPCYTLDKAQAKAASKKQFKRRVARYAPVESYEVTQPNKKPNRFDLPNT